jgi:hypothetical protein
MMLSRDRSAARSLVFAVGAVAAVVTLAETRRVARADDGVVDEEPAAPTLVSRSVEAGGLLSSGLSPRNDGRRGLVMAAVGWNDARASATYDVAAEAHLLGPLSVRAGAFSDGPDTSTSTHVELQLDAVKQATHGVDVAVAVGYSGAGFSTVPAAVLKVAIGRSMGASYVLANMGYEQGLQDNERSGELRLAVLRPLSRSVHVGIDSRFQIDLERDDDEPPGETESEWRTGFVASHTWNRLVFTVNGGVSALRLRGSDSTAVGPIVTGGFGTVF